MLNINLFGGPGTGKSTTAAGLFAEMKAAGFKVELTQEYAKDLVYSECHNVLKDQFFVTANQNHRVQRLHGKVEYAIHDSPIILGAIFSEYTGALRSAYEWFIIALFKSYTSVNIFLVRDVIAHPYQGYGRNQDLDEAIILDEAIKSLLKKHSIPFIEVPIASATATIYKDIILKGITC